ncbi:hypothetical protein PMPD1_1059 [Paramixta manurensis]|uniref:Uncharacterized protein n=1 Tax=Paramixta manurensis TaxID=2740817 RepID=A0A6M8U5W9_9GAMM|nr:hypothetical protein PMPD1_1059 [Erwiniaceae bacterium PD-1]
MNRSEIDRLTDEIIGEAVLSLFKENGPVTNQSLIGQLRTMEAGEPNRQRRELIARVITEVKNNMASGRRRALREQQSGDNVHPLFGSKPLSETNKKH